MVMHAATAEITPYPSNGRTPSSTAYRSQLEEISLLVHSKCLLSLTLPDEEADEAALAPEGAKREFHRIRYPTWHS